MILIKQVAVHHCHVIIDAAVGRTSAGAHLRFHCSCKAALLRIFAGEAVICHKLFPLAIKQFGAVAQERSRDHLALDGLRIYETAWFKLLKFHIDKACPGLICHCVTITDQRFWIC